MITIISGTNRKNSKTEIVSKTYLELFKKNTDEAVNFLSLDNLPADFLNEAMYSLDGQSIVLAKLQDEIIIPANKFFVVS
ncbi:MAG: chromate reductase, partial [Flavobacteriales bacterium]